MATPRIRSALLAAYDEGRIALTAAQRRVATAQAKLAREATRISGLQAQLSRIAADAYRTGGSDELLQLVTASDPQDFLSRAATMDQLAKSNARSLLAVRIERRRLQAQQELARQALADQQRIERRLAATKATIEQDLARQQDLVTRLETAAARRQRLARAAQALRARERASRSRSRDYGSYTGPASGRAGEAVRWAYAQLGKPYRYGAAGPDSFDCSGLTMYVWAHAGVSLPHSSRAQFSSGRHVSRGDLQPGDLVFFGSPIHHVGIFVGGGRYIAAPHTGDVVSFRDLGRSDYAGAVRP
ncbi:MAG: NlpC/P60 family protein [Frankia sp.]|nr:NlpC/P60 family protein [Frankia sp.]